MTRPIALTQPPSVQAHIKTRAEKGSSLVQVKNALTGRVFTNWREQLLGGVTTFYVIRAALSFFSLSFFPCLFQCGMASLMAILRKEFADFTNFHKATKAYRSQNIEFALNNLGLNKIRGALSRENSTLQETTKKLETENGKLCENVDKFSKENSELHGSVQRFETENSTLQKTTKKLETENSKLCENIDNFSKENSELHGSVQRFKTENSELHKNVQEFEGKVKRLEQELIQIEQSNEEYAFNNKRHEQLLNTLSSTATDLAKELQDAIKSNSNVSSRVLQGFLNGVERLQQQGELLEGVQRELSDENSAHLAQLENLLSQVRDASDSQIHAVTEANATLLSSREDLEKVQQDLSHYQGLAKALREEISYLQRVREDLQAEIANLTAARQGIEGAVNELNQTIFTPQKRLG